MLFPQIYSTIRFFHSQIFFCPSLFFFYVIFHLYTYIPRKTLNYPHNHNSSEQKRCKRKLRIPVPFSRQYQQKRRPKPVSYTHLDVYKRQAMQGVLPRVLAALFDARKGGVQPPGGRTPCIAAAALCKELLQQFFQFFLLILGKDLLFHPLLRCTLRLGHHPLLDHCFPACSGL